MKPCYKDQLVARNSTVIYLNVFILVTKMFCNKLHSLCCPVGFGREECVGDVRVPPPAAAHHVGQTRHARQRGRAHARVVAHLGRVGHVVVQRGAVVVFIVLLKAALPALQMKVHSLVSIQKQARNYAQRKPLEISESTQYSTNIAYSYSLCQWKSVTINKAFFL